MEASSRTETHRRPYINAARYGTNALAPGQPARCRCDHARTRLGAGRGLGRFLRLARSPDPRHGRWRPAGGTLDWTLPIESMVSDHRLGRHSLRGDGVSPIRGSPWPCWCSSRSASGGHGYPTHARRPGPHRRPARRGCGVGGLHQLPSGTGASIVPVVVAPSAVVLGPLAVLVERLRMVGLLAGGVFLAPGVCSARGAVDPVLPTDVPFAFERLVTALALGAVSAPCSSLSAPALSPSPSCPTSQRSSSPAVTLRRAW